MKVSLKYNGDEILSYDTNFDPGFGHFMTVFGCLLDALVCGEGEYIIVEVSSGEVVKE